VNACEVKTHLIGCWQNLWNTMDREMDEQMKRQTERQAEGQKLTNGRRKEQMNTHTQTDDKQRGRGWGVIFGGTIW